MKKKPTNLPFLLNRAKKIERNKKKRLGKKYMSWKRIDYTQSEKYVADSKLRRVLKDKGFYQRDRHYSADKNIGRVIMPVIFCLVRNPEETICTLRKINYMLHVVKVKSLYLDYSKCEFLGLGASVIMDAMVMMERVERTRKQSDLIVEGNYPNTDEALQMFLVSGLIKHLEIKDTRKVESPRIERLDPFMKSCDSNELTNKVIDYYDRCLKRNGYQLTPEGINYFNELAGEIIDNLENHSGKNGTWYVSGHFEQSKNEELGKGSLVFISIGNTIYESLKETASNDIRLKLDTYFHKQYGNLANIRNKERSWTMLALQYMISRLNNSEDPDRGTGTIKFIESFTALGNTSGDDRPLMSVISGGIQIIFDGTYKILYNDKKIPVIAFNKDNDLNKKPDGNVVKLLQNKFPGVIISIEFYVDKKYLTKVRNESRN